MRWAVLVFLLVACDEKKDAPAPPVNVNVPVPVDGSGKTPASATSPATSPGTAAAAPTWITAQHVLVAYKGAKGAPKDVKRTKDEAKKRADEVVAKARSGTDFSTLVAEYSEDPGSKDRQGSLGKFTREKMTKPFADAAFALAVDGVSDVVETEFGFHVIKRNQ